MKKNNSYFITLLMMSILMFMSVPFSAFADDKTSENYKALIDTGFESGEYEGWTSFGMKSELSITNEKAYGGFSCLKSHSRTAAWSGPSLNITDIITPGEEYLFRVYAISDKADEMEILLTLKYVDNEGTESYNNMTAAVIGNDKWAFIETSAVIPENIKDAIFYIESGDGLDDFCVDDISIYGYNMKENESIQEDDDDSLSFDFESGTEGWIPRGEVLMEISKDFSYSGKQSLYVYDKVENWNAPMIRITSVVPGVNYTYSAYVMYIDKQCDEDHYFSIRLQYNLNGEEIYKTIKSKLLHNGTWSKISGDYILPAEATDIYFYIRADDDNGDVFENLEFYVDNVKIVDSTAMVKLRRRNIALMAVASLAALVVLFFILRHFIRKSNETKAALRASTLDSMTGACNRNTYEEYVAELEKNPEKCEDLYVMACDVNFLKYINDNYGHDCGDRAIIRCAGVLLRVVGKKGTVYRIGGDEFICFSTVNLMDAVNVEFARENLDYKGYPFSAAVGVAHYDPQVDLGGADIKVIIARSDKAMYKNKVEIKKSVDFID